jgi:2-polyprenyl-3-methyl-5-hydroxy-6-metoxy-1,4-benzoquinol methylase
MFDFHKNKTRYFEMQYLASKDSIVPMIEKHIELKKGIRVLEVGCAEGGVLKAFLEKDCECMGIELMENRIKRAEEFLQEYKEQNKISFLAKNIYDIELTDGELYDVIILKDVIEHIPEQEKILAKLKGFLKNDGVMFFGFPSWYMPFGGHQQMCKTKVLSIMPYYHLLPRFLYKWILKTFNNRKQLENLLDIYDTGISTKRFEKVSKNNKLKVLERKAYFIPPIYKYKFKKKVRRLNPIINGIPLFREFFTLSAYYILKKQ